MSYSQPWEMLLLWYSREGRDLPWRKTTDPYAVLVSELMLQQTQVDRVIPKYLAWLEAFPTWTALTNAKRSKVLRMWSGLGYNSRAARLHTLASLIFSEYSGRLPRDEDELKKLPGLGPYTAGSVRCFAFDLPGKCVDVNVERVIKRSCFSLKENPSRVDVERELAKAQSNNSPRDLANALMDLGSFFCKAKNPSCDSCPVNSACKAKGERPEEQIIRAKKKQKTFLHSNRWWRGQILKQLTLASGTPDELFLRIGEKSLKKHKESFGSALKELKDEGFMSGTKKVALKD